MIISIGGQKGGTGKTTVACELAVNLSTQGHKVMFIDGDIQGSATRFCNYRREAMENIGFSAIQLADKAIMTEALNFEEIFDYVIIDSGGYDSPSQRYAIACADLYLAVFNPQRLATDTLHHVEQMVEQMKAANDSVQTFSMINLGWSSGDENDESAEILQKSTVFEFCPAIINRRKAICDAGSQGLSVFERKRKDPKAEEELTNLFSFLNSFKAQNV